MKREHFRGVVWAREPTSDGTKTNYRYAVVGLLVTNEPIPELEEKTKDGVTEVALDGNAFGLSDILRGVPKTTMPYKAGDASEVLISLGDWD